MSDNQNGAISNARELGRPKMLVLGVQHMFAMFGATVLVPTLTGLSVSSTLLFAGVGTLLFHLLTKWKVPAFLGSSFAFIGGYQAIAPCYTRSWRPCSKPLAPKRSCAIFPPLSPAPLSSASA